MKLFCEVNETGNSVETILMYMIILLLKLLLLLLLLLSGDLWGNDMQVV